MFFYFTLVRLQMNPHCQIKKGQTKCQTKVLAALNHYLFLHLLLVLSRLRIELEVNHKPEK